MLTLKWQKPPERLSLEAGKVHIWRARVGPVKTERWWRILSDDERARADRFHFPRDRDRFIFQRGLLRRILSQYIETAEVDIRFEYGERGKPHLPKTAQGAHLHFNLSHSGDTVVYAFAEDRPVGIDVEQIRKDVDFERIAGRFFTEDENLFLESLPSHERQRAFFYLWVCKEAYIKTRGEGFNISFKSFSVRLDTKMAQVFIVSQKAVTQDAYKLEVFMPESDIVAAVASEGSDWMLKGYDAQKLCD